MKKRNILVLIVGGLLISLSACGPGQPKDQHIIGTWVEDCDEPAVEISLCSSFDFTADGHFEAKNILQTHFWLNHPKVARVNRSGTWSLDAESGKIRLSFDADPELQNGYGYSSEFFINSERDQFVLFAWTEEDDRVFFSKQDD